MTTGLSLFFLCFTQVFYLGVYFSPRSTGSVSDVEGPINLAFCIMYCSGYVEIFHYYTSVSPTPLRYLYFFFNTALEFSRTFLQNALLRHSKPQKLHCLNCPVLISIQLQTCTTLDEDIAVAVKTVLVKIALNIVLFDKHCATGHGTL